MSNEQQQDENKLIAERRTKLATIREQASEDNCSAFPNDFRREDLAADLQAQYGEESKEALETLDHQVSVAGRVIRNRGAFMVIQDMSGTIQLYVAKEANLTPPVLSATSSNCFKLLNISVLATKLESFCDVTLAVSLVLFKADFQSPCK